VNAGRLDEAKAPLERARELNPKELLVYLNLGDIAEQQGRFDEQQKLMMEVVQQNPEATIPRAILAQIYRDNGDPELAHRIYQSCRADAICASELGSFYVSLGIDIKDPRLLNDYVLLTKHYLAGDVDRFAQIVLTLNGPPLPDKAKMYASVGHWDEAYKLMQDNPEVFEPLLQGLASDNSLPTYNEIALLATLSHQSDPRAKAFQTSLSKRYQDAVPSENMQPGLYFNGARWQMLEDDPDGAMVWLNALAERGISYQVGPDPMFEPLTPRADYQAFLARMESYRERDRALIEAQLANPPEVWWSPDELTEVAE
jgi:tetratricopeptide (TPR) repeat protein